MLNIKDTKTKTKNLTSVEFKLKILKQLTLELNLDKKK